MKRDDALILAAIVAAMLLLSRAASTPKPLKKDSPFPVIDWLRDL